MQRTVCELLTWLSRVAVGQRLHNEKQAVTELSNDCQTRVVERTDLRKLRCEVRLDYSYLLLQSDVNFQSLWCTIIRLINQIVNEVC